MGCYGMEKKITTKCIDCGESFEATEDWLRLTSKCECCRIADMVKCVYKYKGDKKAKEMKAK